jgi:hypothetical protein
MNADAIIGAVPGVTRKWCKQRKAEEREADRAFRRRDAFVSSDRVTIKDAAYEVLEEAYLKASGGGRLPAHARQIMYAARGDILDLTGKDKLDDKYFTKTFLPEYLDEHPGQTADWDVVFDARGHFEEPHTDKVVPLGTIDVRDYLHDVEAHEIYWAAPAMDLGDDKFPTAGPPHRFGAVLFIEKEGFLPLFKAVHLAARYDVAVMSTKGTSVTAARQLVDTICHEYRVPLLVLHDFDKAGFSIVGTLRRDTRRYQFANDIEVIDLGLRLADVEARGLEAEDVVYKSDPTANLRQNGATAAEIAFLYRGAAPFRGHVGRRVELNAFTADGLVAWVEDKLDRHGGKKLVPDAETLGLAYRREWGRQTFAERVGDIAEEVHAEAEELTVPRGLAGKVKKVLKADPALPWDKAIARLVLQHEGA